MTKKRYIFFVLLALLLVGLGVRFFLEEGQQEHVGTTEKIEIVDSVGRKVTVPCSPQRIVTLNTDAGEMIAALGASERIVGVTDGEKFPLSLNDKSHVGLFTAPSLEKIVALNPDLIIAYSGSMKSEVMKQIAQTGIPVILLDCYKVHTFVDDVTKLGRILKKEQEAAAYLQMIDHYLHLIQKRVAQIPKADRKTVYIESYSDYSTVSESGAAQMLETAGGINIARNMKNMYNQVSPEWVVTQNPEVIIKGVGSSVVSGYHKDNLDMKKARQKLMQRLGWARMQAMQQEQVYLLGTDLWTGPRQIVGITYMAKWLYPERFPDLDPAAIHREILKKYHQSDDQGAWAYPE